MLPRASVRHYKAQQRREVVVRAAARRAWRRMGNDFDASWRAVLVQLLPAVTLAQRESAGAAADYIDRVLAETNQDADPAGEVVPSALAGTASDGRPLDSLLYGAVTSSKDAMTAGATPDEALTRGGNWLDMAVWTQVADAARLASGVSIAARPRVTGYVRMLNPPSCARCAILAGRHYRWNTGFQRHPRCDCTHIPAGEDIAGDLRTDPKTYFNSLSTAEQDRIFTNAGARAVRDGADVGQVVNARRGMSTLTTPSGRRVLARERVGSGDVFVTREGITRRGQAYRGRTGRNMSARLMPESIYEIAGNDRAEAIRLLRLHGYLT